MDGNVKTHPLVIIAASTVIATCLLAIGVMTGVVPSPLTRHATPAQELASAPATSAAEAPRAPAASLSRFAPTPPEPTQPRVVEVAPVRSLPSGRVGATSASAPSHTVAGHAPAAAPPACRECGSVTSVHSVRRQGDAGLLGPAAGGLVGGLLGHQIGHGSGNTIATVVGAGAGAAAGTEIERRYKSTTDYVVAVRMNDGAVRHFTYASAPGLHAGDRVRVVDSRLVRE